MLCCGYFFDTVQIQLGNLHQASTRINCIGHLQTNGVVTVSSSVYFVVSYVSCFLQL